MADLVNLDPLQTIVKIHWAPKDDEGAATGDPPTEDPPGHCTGGFGGAPVETCLCPGVFCVTIAGLSAVLGTVVAVKKEAGFFPVCLSDIWIHQVLTIGSSANGCTGIPSGYELPPGFEWV